MRRTTADTGHSWAGREHIPRYIHQPGYIAGLIYGPREPRYNGFPLYNETLKQKKKHGDKVRH